MGNLKETKFEFEMTLYDSAIALGEAKEKIASLKKYSIKNICNFLLDKSAEAEKEAWRIYNSEKEIYDKSRVCLDEIIDEIKLDNGQIDENLDKENMKYSYGQKIESLKNMEKDLEEVINLGKKIVEIQNDTLKKMDRADLYLKSRYATERNEKDSVPVRGTLYFFIYGESDKNKIIGKIYLNLSNLAKLMKAFVLKIDKINKKRPDFLETEKLKERNIAAKFMDYYYFATINDMKRKKNLSDDMRILDGLCEQVSMIAREAFEAKKTITAAMERLYTNHRNSETGTKEEIPG